MNFTLQISLMCGVIIYYIILLHLLKRKSLDLKYTLLWIFSGIIMLIMALFPSLMEYLTHMLGIVDVTNGLFALVLFLVILILMSITAIVSKMKRRNKQLVQQYALLEKRLRELEVSSRNKI